MAQKAHLTFQNKTVELPIVTGNMGEIAVDISNLRRDSGLITLDPGFANTGSCLSAITYTDGENGILKYRGIDISAFIDKPNFVEVAWLLIFGKLPEKEQYTRFSQILTNSAHIDEDMKHHFAGFPRSAPPMAVLSAMVSTLSCYYPEFHQLESVEDIELAAAKLMSKIRTLAAFAYRRSQGLPYIYPDPGLPYVCNFLHMMFSMPYDRFECSDDVRQILNLMLILHADHEQNCSTSTVRMVGSSKANLFASCAAGVSALWGSLHGGANVKVIEMLEYMQANNLSPSEFILKVKDKKDNLRLMGFGHRVYKNFDPRARVLKEISKPFLEKVGHDDPLLELALKLEEAALNDSYFIERKLYPNIDFYSGIILRAIGIPTNMFTVLFAIGRMPGWIAHWSEQQSDSSSRISRPRQIYIGETDCEYQSRISR